MVADNYAYSLAQDALGWRWRVYDEDGEVVGAGRKATQGAAEIEIKRTIAVVFAAGMASRTLEVRRLIDPPSVGAGAAIGVFAADR